MKSNGNPPIFSNKPTDIMFNPMSSNITDNQLSIYIEIMSETNITQKKNH